MMKNTNNTHIVTEKLNSNLWKSFDILRGTSIEDLQIVFLMISAYKDGVFQSRESYESEDLAHFIIERLYHSDKYFEIFQVYESIIQLMAPKRLNALYEYLNSINRHELDVLRSNFSEIFETLLSKYLVSVGNKSGEVFQPLEISRFVMNLANINNIVSIYNPFAGLGSYGILLAKGQKYYGQEINEKTWALGMLRFLAHNNSSDVYYSIRGSIENFNGNICYEEQDSLDYWFDYKKLDLIVSTPPFNLKMDSHFLESSSIKTAEHFLIRKGLKSLKENGKLICVLPQGFLFRGGEDKRVRKELVNNKYLDSIVALPSGLLKNTGIPVCILVISKTQSNGGLVRMINATDFYTLNGPKDRKLDDVRLVELVESRAENEFQCFVSKEEIQLADYNLNVPRYFAKEYPGVKLASIVEYKRGERIQEGEKGRFVRIRDLKDDKLNHLLDVEQIEFRKLPRIVRKIEESSLLLSMRWKTLKPTYFKYKDTPIYISNDILPVQIDESKVDPFYLINELHSESVLNQLNSYRITAAVQFISRNDLFNIKIELPSLEEQRGKVKGLKELSNKIKALEKERNALAHGKAIDEFDEFRSLKHSLGAPRQNILSNAKSLIRFFDKNNSDAFIEVKKQFKNHYETDLSDVLMQIRDNIDHISVILEKGEGGLILNNYQNEIVSLKDINTILKNYSDSEYKFSTRYEPLKKDEIGKNALNCNSTLFKILLDNIFSNANKYGFVEKAPGNEVVIEVKPLEDFLEVVIKNNGLPFPKNFTKEKFITKFSTVDSNNGSGLGGYDINRISRYFGDNEWQLLLEDTMYPVEFKFNFPLIKIENE